MRMAMSDNNENWPCVVCGHYSFDGPPETYDICSVCGWEDDSVQAKHPRMKGGANGGSIFDYQKDYLCWEVNPMERDPDWRLLEKDEASLPSNLESELDYSLDYYAGGPPYYWRVKNA